MRKFVTKEINETKVLLTEVKIEKGEIVSTDIEPMVVYGKVTDEQIKKVLKKTYPKQNILIKGKLELTRNYRMTVDKFIELAEEYVPNKKNEIAGSQPDNESEN